MAGEAVAGVSLDDLHRHVLRLRRVDERLLGLQRQGRIGFYGPATGQEAVAVGAALAIERRDWVFPALREAGVMLVRGYPLPLYVAQLFGSALDPMKGRQMPSHMASRSVNQVSWSSSIGTQLPHAVGAAHAARLRGHDIVALAFLGDGATSHPDFHAALNFAGLWAAPVVFVCQNNRYAISVPVARQTASASLAVKAQAYGFAGEIVDGNDARAVYAAVLRAAHKARSGGGPTLLECSTYRIGPHSTSDDPSRYRPDSEVASWEAKDPLTRLRAALRAESTFDEEREATLLAAVDHELDQAIREAESAPRPALSSLFDDVYCVPPWHLREQRAELVTASSDARARS